MNIIEMVFFKGDLTTSKVSGYLLSVFLIFIPSYILFNYIMKIMLNIGFIKTFYYSLTKRCTVYYTIILVFFGFLPLFFSLISIEEIILGEINNIFLAVSMGSLLPYFYLLIEEARKSDNIRSENTEIINKQKNEKVNKKFDNIYFILSIVFLIFIFFLIFFRFKEVFNFDITLGFKDIFTVLGTLGGAFLGAYLASRYSSNQVSRQMNHQRHLIQEQSLSAALKYSLTATSITAHSMLILEAVLKKMRCEGDAEKILKYLESSKEKLDLEIAELLSLNLISTLSIKMYPPIYKSLQMIYEAIDEISLCLEESKNTENLDMNINLAYFENDLRDTKSILEENFAKALQVYKAEAEERVLLSKKLNQ